MTRPAALAAGLLAVCGAALACTDDTISQCFEPVAGSYHFAFPGNDSLVFNWVGEQPVRVYAEPPASFQGHVDTAIAVWNSAFRCGELAISRTTDSNVADIIVRNPDALPPAPGPAFAADSIGACLGRTDIDTLNREVLRPIRTWIAPASLDSTDIRGCFRFATAHELGHTLGLLRHSTDANDLMYSSPFRRLLTDIDRHTIQILYHTPPTVGAAPR